MNEKNRLQKNSIEVLDGLVSPELIRQLNNNITINAYGCGGRSRPEDPYKFWVARIENEDLMQVTAFRKLWEILEENVTDGKYEPYHILVNANTFGDCPTVHTDLPTELCNDHYTVLYFAHDEWHYDWAGETVLLNDSKTEIIKSVYPHPGRILAFDSRIPHVARTPTRISPAVRFTIAFKLRPKGYKE